MVLKLASVVLAANVAMQKVNPMNIVIPQAVLIFYWFFFQRYNRAIHLNMPWLSWKTAVLR